jgi:hypothetical protein
MFPWQKAAVPEPEPAGMPTAFIVCTVMWIIHGFVLDILVIGVLPFLSVKASDDQRADKFPWALGGYAKYAKVPNLEPTHRRFIAENAAYAVLRIAPAIFITNQEVLLLCVVSYFIEGVTIAWEIMRYDAPPKSMVPQTLMGVFASVTTYAYTTNEGGFIKDVDPMLLMATQATCGLTWLCWLGGALTTATKKTK